MAEDKTKFRSVQFSREQIDEEKRTIEFSAASEEPYERWDGVETLCVSQESIDWSRLKNAAPLLLEHDTRKQIGVIEKSWIDGKKLRVQVRFSKSALAEEIFQDVLDGIRRNVSIGYMVHEEDRKKGEKGAADKYTATKWEPMEVSIVPIPADNTVGVGRAASVDTPAAGMENTSTKAAEPAAPAAPAAAAAPVVTKTHEPAPRNRENDNADIRAICEKSGIPKEEAENFVSIGASVEDVRKVGFARIVERSNKTAEVSPVILPEKERKEYSIFRAIQSVLSGKQVGGLEGEVSRELAKVRGIEPTGFFMPRSIFMGRRDLAATDFSAGGSFVGTDIRPDQFIDLLRNSTVVDKLGIRRMTGLQGNAAIPMQTGAATAYWAAEAADTTGSTPATGNLVIAPHRLSAKVAYSKQFLFQSAVAGEQFVRDDLMEVLALEQDRVVLCGDGSDGEPVGILNTTGINAGVTFGGAATLADLLQFVADLEEDNALKGSLGFALSPSTKQKWSSIARISSTDSRTLYDTITNTVEGYKTVSSAQMTAAPLSSRVIFGNWNDLVLAEWDGLDLTVDPLTLAGTQQVRIIMHTHCDVFVRHPVSFSVSTDSGAQ